MCVRDVSYVQYILLWRKKDKLSLSFSDIYTRSHAGTHKVCVCVCVDYVRVSSCVFVKVNSLFSEN